MIVLAGCAAGDDVDPTHIDVKSDLGVDETDDDGTAELCALAEELPDDDICSLICDPFAMAARLLEDGAARGACYQLYCTLPDDQGALVGVCLP